MPMKLLFFVRVRYTLSHNALHMLIIMFLFNTQLFNPYRPFNGIKANRIAPDVTPQKKRGVPSGTILFAYRNFIGKMK